MRLLVEQMKHIHDMAVVAYTPLVDDLCSRKATQNEVEWMLDWLLMYAGDDRMLLLYKRVCRAYWQIYPDSIAFYIMEYRKEYDPESLVGTEYEYLLHGMDYYFSHRILLIPVQTFRSWNQQVSTRKPVLDPST